MPDGPSYAPVLTLPFLPSAVHQFVSGSLAKFTAIRRASSFGKPRGVSASAAFIVWVQGQPKPSERPIGINQTVGQFVTALWPSTSNEPKSCSSCGSFAWQKSS